MNKLKGKSDFLSSHLQIPPIYSRYGAYPFILFFCQGVVLHLSDGGVEDGKEPHALRFYNCRLRWLRHIYIKTQHTMMTDDVTPKRAHNLCLKHVVLVNGAKGAELSSASAP